MEQAVEFAKDPTLITGMIVVIGALVATIIAMVGALVTMWKYIRGEMSVIIKDNTKSNEDLSSGLSKVGEALNELKRVVIDNTKAFAELEKSNAVLSERINHIK